MDVVKKTLLLTESFSRSLFSFFLTLLILTSFVTADATGAVLPELFENQEHTAYVNLSSNDELDLVLGYVVTQYPDHLIRYITKATDLQEGGLETRLFLDQQGNVSSPQPGMMFSDRAVILVVDYRQMTATQMAELNGLLDNVRTYNGNTLSDTTRILAVVDESVLSGSWSPDAPGSDFWRRVNKIRKPLDISLLQSLPRDCLPTLEQYVNRHVWKDIPFDVSYLTTKMLDFASGLSATDVLSGGIDLDSLGGLSFRDAALGESGNTLFILKDAPWQDMAFKVQLASTLANRGVDSGDRCLALPARYFLLRTDTAPEELAHILETFEKRYQRSQPRWFPMNSVNFELVFSGLTLRKGQLVKSDAVGHLNQDFDGIEVTSTLTSHQWQRLAGLLSEGGPLENLSLRVRDKNQPVLIPDSLFQTEGAVVNGSLLQRLPGAMSLETIQETYPGAHIEVISPSLDSSGLLETIRLESRQQRQFQQQPTGLYKALQSASQPVIITGLESNPGIQKLLESLLSGTPSVPRFGQLSPIHSQTDIRVQWLKPELAQTAYWSNWLSQTSGPAGESADEGDSMAGLPPSEPVHVNWNNPEQLVTTVKEAIKNHTLVYLEGPPGSGKSYIANRVAKSLAGEQVVYQLTTGPATRREDLFGEQVMRPLSNHPDDSETRFVEGPILQWAQQRSKNGEPVVLILDEGNLLDKNVQVLLSGVTLKQSFISSNGDVYYLSPEHRLIITGNPLSFKGRHIIPELHNHAKTIQFAAMDSAGLSVQVIVPFLTAMDPQRCSLDQCDWIADLLLEKMAGYQKQLPDYSFSARDTLDVLSRFQFYLGDLTQKTIHEIENTFAQALYDSFSGQLAAQKRSAGLSSRSWYVKHHAFEGFYDRLSQESTSLHLDNDSTKSLTRRIWLELERVAGEKTVQQSHPGRHGMMIEGPAGRGKDVVLDIVMKQWREDWAQKGLILSAPLRITAGYNNWDTLKAMIIQAKTEGRILIVSELNLLPTHFLEGVLNDVLAGEAAPGFFLFATVNPVQYSGRHAFSSALASRFTQLILDEYTLNDFKAIAASYSDSHYADDIALWHHKRVEILKNDKAQAIPDVLVMIEFLKASYHWEKVDPNALRSRFMSHYRLYLKDGWRPDPVVVPVEADVVKVLEKNVQSSSGLVGYAGQMTARSDATGVISEDKPEKIVTDNQSRSFMAKIGAIVEEGAAVVNRVIESLSKFPSQISMASVSGENDGQWVVTDSLNHQAGELVSDTESYQPDSEKQTITLNRRGASGPESGQADLSLDGDFNQGESHRLNKRFTSDFPPPFYRLKIKRMRIDDDGTVRLEPFPAGELTPYPLGNQQVDIRTGQHHGIQDHFKKGELTSLFPHEKLVGIWTEDNRHQPIEVQYDASRGFYIVDLPESGDSSTTRLHYIVEEDKVNEEPEILAPVEAYQAPLVWIDRLSRLLEEKKELARELGHIQNLSQKQRVESIIAYVKRFTKPPKGVASLENQVSNTEMLAELIERRIGNCRHIAFAAAGLMQFYGIPVRVMYSESHAWVEYSLNNGKTWHTSETWGTYGDIENPEDFGDRSLISGHDDSEHSPDESVNHQVPARDNYKSDRAAEAEDDALVQEPPREGMVIQHHFYHEHSAALYRQSIQYMSIDDDGIVYFTNLPSRGIRIPALPDDIDEQQLSNQSAVRGEQVIKTGERTPLTSLSAQEKLLALSFEGMASRQYQLEYDAFQRLYFITVNKEGDKTEGITLRFLVQLDELPFSPEALMVDKQKPSLLTDKIRNKLDAFFKNYPEVYNNIGIHPKIDQNNEKIEKILSFVRGYLPKKPLSSEVSLTLLTEHMHQWLGDCRYRSYIAATLVEYFNLGIARVVSNDLNVFIEVSLDGGVYWQSYDLYGYKLTKYTEQPLGTELLKNGWYSLKELPQFELTLSSYPYRAFGIDEKILYSSRHRPMDTALGLFYSEMLEEVYKLYGDSREQTLGYFKNLLLYFNVDPSRLRDIPYLLQDDPEVRQKLSPWLNEQVKNLQVKMLDSTELRSKKGMNVVNIQLNGSPFEDLEQMITKRASGFKPVWNYQPPGQLQINRLLENKAAFAHTREHHELKANRCVIFNVGESPLRDKGKRAHYETILLNKLDKDKVKGMATHEIKQLVEQSLFDATYHLSQLTDQQSGVLKRYEKERFTYGFRLYKPQGVSLLQESEWLWTQIVSPVKSPFQITVDEYDVMQTSIPLAVNLLPEEWQDAVIIDGDMLHNLSTRYLESLSSEQVENIRKVLSSSQ